LVSILLLLVLSSERISACHSCGKLLNIVLGLLRLSRNGCLLLGLLVGPSLRVLAHLLLFFFDHLYICDISSVLWLLRWLREACEWLLLRAWEWGLLEVSHSPVSFGPADWHFVAASILLLVLLSLALGVLLRVDLLYLLLHLDCLLVADVSVLLLVLLVEFSWSCIGVSSSAHLLAHDLCKSSTSTAATATAAPTAFGLLVGIIFSFFLHDRNGWLLEGAWSGRL